MNGYGYGRRYRARYMPQQPPSPWSYLLGGIGTGITQSLEKIIQEKERKRSMTDQVLESVIQGTFDPRVLATEEGRDWAIRNLRYKSPEVQKLMYQGQIKAGLLGPGGMGPPAPYTLPAHQEKLKEEIEAEEEKKFNEELRQIERKEKLRLQIKKEAQPSPEKIAEVQELLSKHGLAPENITVNIDGVNYDLQTALEKAEAVRKLAEEGQKEKAIREKTYEGKEEKLENLEIAAGKFRLSGITKLSAILSGEPTDFDELTTLIKEAMRDMVGKESKVAGKEELEAMTPKERFDHLRLEYNKIIGAYNRRMKSIGKKMRLKEMDMPKLKLIGTKLEDIEPPEPVTDEQKRGVIITPKAKDEETIDPSEVSPTEAIIINSAGEKMVVRGGKWVKVKKSY